MKPLSITHVGLGRYESIINGLAWLVNHSNNDIIYESRNSYEIQIIKLTDDIKVFIGGNINGSSTYVGCVRNDGDIPGNLVIIMDDGSTTTRKSLCDKIAMEFELFYIDEPIDSVPKNEYIEVCEEIIDEIYALSSNLRIKAVK